MNKFLLLDRLGKIIKYAKDNYIRLLIEADPGYTKLYIYTDKIHYSLVEKQVLKYAIDRPLKWSLTDEKMYYPETALHLLEMEKGEVKKRFFNSNVNVTKEYIGKTLVYFVDVKGKFDKEEKKAILDKISNGSIDGLKANRIGKNRVAVYKYE